MLIVITFPSSYANPQNITRAYQLNCNGKTYDVVFNIFNTTITDLNGTNLGERFLIHYSPNGKLVVHVPKDIDTLYDGYAVILTNGQKLPYYALNNTALLYTSDFEVEITLTEMEGVKNLCFIVPEFGSLALTVAAVSIFGVVLIQKRLKL